MGLYTYLLAATETLVRIAIRWFVVLGGKKTAMSEN
jgi:hypothetical protein